MLFLKRRLNFIIHKLPFLLIVLCIFLTPANKNAMANQTEYSVKAAFILNFMKFTTWPPTVSNASDPFQLCIKGSSAILDQFNIIDDKKVRGRSLQLQQMPSTETSQKCDIIFISRDTPLSVSKKILSSVKGMPILTIGETKGFAKQGGVINFFFKQNNRLHFEINPNTAKRQGIAISALLLEIALIVND